MKTCRQFLTKIPPLSTFVQFQAKKNTQDLHLTYFKAQYFLTSSRHPSPPLPKKFSTFFHILPTPSHKGASLLARRGSSLDKGRKNKGGVKTNSPPISQLHTTKSQSASQSPITSKSPTLFYFILLLPAKKWA